MITNNVKTANQIQVQDVNGNPVVPMVGNKGGMLVEMASGSSTVKEETTLNSNYITVGTTGSVINVSNSKITEIAVANYSEEATITVTIGTAVHNIGPNIAIELPVNKTGITSITITASVADTKVQYAIKGVEADD